LSHGPHPTDRKEHSTMGKPWLFRKTMNDHEAGSLHGHCWERDRRYVPDDFFRQLYERGSPVPWPDVNHPASWLLNSGRVSGLLVP
jgi:hypothetical protein